MGESAEGELQGNVRVSIIRLAVPSSAPPFPSFPVCYSLIVKQTLVVNNSTRVHARSSCQQLRLKYRCVQQIKC